ncbi:hypothetical protein PFISCL1PPCAC_21841, partial [Pristionchus fissidentatus]
MTMVATAPLMDRVSLVVGVIVVEVDLVVGTWAWSARERGFLVRIALRRSEAARYPCSLQLPTAKNQDEDIGECCRTRCKKICQIYRCSGTTVLDET